MSMIHSNIFQHQSRQATFSLPVKHIFTWLDIVRQWLDAIEICDRNLARFLCKVIPVQCPFERDIQLFGRKVAHIPPLCKLNPFYEQLVGLRFRAMCYLVDCCGESV